MFEFWSSPYFTFSESDRKIGAFQKISTWSILKMKRNRKWNSPISGHFKKNMQMLSHDKIIFHMLFGAFHVTPRMWNGSVNFNFPNCDASRDKLFHLFHHKKIVRYLNEYVISEMWLVMFYVDGLLSMLHTHAIKYSKISTISKSGTFHKSCKMPTQNLKSI